MVVGKRISKNAVTITTQDYLATAQERTHTAGLRPLRVVEIRTTLQPTVTLPSIQKPSWKIFNEGREVPPRMRRL